VTKATGGLTSFLQNHQVALITLDIGANDVDGCVSSTAIDKTCIDAGFARVSAKLAVDSQATAQSGGPEKETAASHEADAAFAGSALRQPTRSTTTGHRCAPAF
jgi:hypothetical protein